MPKCPICYKQLRPKEQSDWNQGEKMYKGHFPKTFWYYYCDKCKRGFVVNKYHEQSQNDRSTL